MKIKFLNQIKEISNFKFQIPRSKGQLKGISNFRFQISRSKGQLKGIPNFRFQISRSKVQLKGIPNFKFQISRSKAHLKREIFGIWNFFGILKFGVLGIFGILISCNSKPTPSVSHAVSPFDTTHFETQALTPEDRMRSIRGILAAGALMVIVRA